MVHINKTGKEIECADCEEPIETDGYFHIEDGDNLCVCCYEDRHEYDHEEEW